MMLDVCGVKWEDTCKKLKSEGNPVPDMRNFVEGLNLGTPILFPPTLHELDTGVVLNQWGNIIRHLGVRYGYAGATPADASKGMCIAMACEDCINEAVTAWHPVSMAMSYKDQKKEAAVTIKKWSDNRLPRFLMYFEQYLKSNNGGKGFVIGKSITFADCALLCFLRGYFGSLPK